METIPRQREVRDMRHFSFGLPAFTCPGHSQGDRNAERGVEEVASLSILPQSAIEVEGKGTIPAPQSCRSEKGTLAPSPTLRWIKQVALKPDPRPDERILSSIGLSTRKPISGCRMMDMESS
jgi:hypothetical protein